MCNLKSGIILKDKIYIPDHDHHTKMLEELSIKDNAANAEKLFVRAELLPPGNDIFSPIGAWKLHIDQDIIPDWFVKEFEEKRMIEAVTVWAKDHIHVGKSNFSIGSSIHYLKECKAVKCGNSTVEACGNSTVTAWGNSTVTAWDNSTVILHSYSINKKENVTLSQNATLKDCKTKTIYQAGDWKLELVKNENQ